MALAVPGAVLAAAGLFLAAAFLQIPPAEKARALWVLGALVMASGGGLIGYALLALRSWAHEYGRLLESVAAEVPTLLTPSDESRELHCANHRCVRAASTTTCAARLLLPDGEAERFN